MFFFLKPAFWRLGSFTSSGLHPSKSDVFSFLPPGDNLNIFSQAHFCSMSLAGSSLTALCNAVVSWWEVSCGPPAVKFLLHGSVRNLLDKSHVHFRLITISSVVQVDHCPAKQRSTQDQGLALSTPSQRCSAVMGLLPIRVIYPQYQIHSQSTSVALLLFVTRWDLGHVPCPSLSLFVL